MKRVLPLVCFVTLSAYAQLPYTIVDTGQDSFFNDRGYIGSVSKGEAFFGQDANYLGNQANYVDNKDGTVTDKVTGLVWQKGFSSKLSFQEAQEYASSSTLGGFSDWRIPTIKELYSLINFNGKTGKGNPQSSSVPSDAKPYLDTNYFDFEYSQQRRYIDAQYWTATDSVSKTMGSDESFFGVNFADGRIKAYPKYRAKYGGAKYYLKLVRANISYGKNSFIVDEKIVYDKATGLSWMKEDSKKGMNWQKALKYCEELTLQGFDDWRLPNAKELQSIVDYSKSPSYSNSAAIDEVFEATKIKNEEGREDYGSYWSSTTHLDGRNLGEQAVYLSFGRALGFLKRGSFGSTKLMDVHGAGAQRSDPKSGDASRFSTGRGPQGDVVRIDNLVRCVRDTNTIVNAKLKESLKEKRVQVVKSRTFKTHPALNRFDLNGDGKISYKEAPKRMQQNFQRHDLNSDGFIANEELKTLPKPR